MENKDQQDVDYSIGAELFYYTVDGEYYYTLAPWGEDYETYSI